MPLAVHDGGQVAKPYTPYLVGGRLTVHAVDLAVFAAQRQSLRRVCKVHRRAAIRSIVHLVLFERLNDVAYQTALCQPRQFRQEKCHHETAVELLCNNDFCCCKAP